MSTVGIAAVSSKHFHPYRLPSLLYFLFPQCPQCFVGLCQKHRLQDSGKRTKDLMEQKQKLNEMNSKLITDKLLQLQGAFGSSGTSDREQQAYRERLASERAKAEARPRQELRGDARSLAASGMNGSTMKIMMGIEDDGSGDSASDSDRKDRKKHKKHSKKHSKKESKKSKKKDKKLRRKEEKRAKKDKKKRSASRTPPPHHGEAARDGTPLDGAAGEEVSQPVREPKRARRDRSGSDGGSDSNSGGSSGGGGSSSSDDSSSSDHSSSEAEDRRKCDGERKEGRKRARGDKDRGMKGGKGESKKSSSGGGGGGGEVSAGQGMWGSMKLFGAPDGGFLKR